MYSAQTLHSVMRHNSAFYLPQPEALARDGIRTHATEAYILRRGTLTTQPLHRDSQVKVTEA